MILKKKFWFTIFLLVEHFCIFRREENDKSIARRAESVDCPNRILRGRIGAEQKGKCRRTGAIESIYFPKEKKSAKRFADPAKQQQFNQ